MKSGLAQAGVVGAMAIGAVVAVTSFGASGGAQADATTSIANPGFDAAPAVSHDGRLVVFESSPNADGSDSSLFLHDRGPVAADESVMPATTTPIADSSGAENPGISGNGCVVTWSIPAVDAEPEPVIPPETQPDPSTGDSTPDATNPGESNTGESNTGESNTSESNTDDATPNASTAPDGAGESTGSIELGEPASGSVVETTGVEAAALQIAPARLVVLDRCTTPTGTRVDLPLSDTDRSFGPAAASLDGSVIAASNGTEVVRFVRAADGSYAEAGRFDGRDTAGTDHLVADRVDVSDDGSVVVFAGGLDLADTALMTVFAHIVENGEASTGPILTSATSPSVSADGTLVVGSTGPGGSSVTLVDRSVAPLAPLDLGPGRRPSISADGNHVVFEEGANLAVVSRTGQGDAPFATTQRTLLSTTITPTRSGPAIDRLGATVVSDLSVDVANPPSNTDIAVTTLPADASFDAARFDLGRGDVGAVLTSTVTFSNRGPSSIGVASLDANGTFVIAEDRCGSVLRPGTTCEIDVSFTVERLEDAIGVVTLTPTSFGVAAFTTEVVALGEAPPATTSATTTTQPGGSTTGGSSTGTTTTGGTTTRGTTTGGTTTRGTSTTGSTRTTTTTTISAGVGVVASPPAFDFAPTIIDAGRRTGLVEIVNNGTAATTIDGVRLEPAEAGPFQIVETTCDGQTVAMGARCAVTLSFAPTATGAQAVSLIASVQGGTDITVAVTGTGAAAPTIAVVPGVANVGQVVTLSGAGFPTGIDVDLNWGSNVQSVVVDDAGTFNVPVVVMSHTATGPAEVSVAGQTDMFDTVTATLLVTHTSDRAGPSIIDGVGPNVGR